MSKLTDTIFLVAIVTIGIPVAVILTALLMIGGVILAALGILIAPVLLLCGRVTFRRDKSDATA